MPTLLSKLLTDAKNRWKSIFNEDLRKAGLNWFKVRALKYAPEGKDGIFELKGRKIHFKNGNELLYSLKEIYIDEIYKISFDIPSPYILDCGANIGLSLLYLKELSPSARITAFEPDESNYALLEKNTGDLKNIILLKKAVWKENGTIQFASEGSLSSKIVTEPGSTAISIPAIRLRDYLTETVDFLKLDIEGAEYEVLKDCADKLSLVKNLFIEYHGQFQDLGELNEILGLLNRNQFYYYIREAAETYPTPFVRSENRPTYDLQLNIFGFKSTKN
ncbi:MAG TPA: FkbM family methyltransferase [Chitinophagaceae bacterium]|nr:FkbM family methyltransferase [Chitinophagaceae bacterium]